MKHLIIAAFAALSLSTFAAQKATSAQNIEIKATGMTCESCVNTLKGEIAKLDLKKFGPVTLDVAVNKVTINLDKVKPALTDAQKIELTTSIKGAITTAKFELAH
jgi:copper chaperone CopZ